ncbi:MAG TPA: PepSY domain-containing protein [Gemmatimonadales bacterium]|jgi:uncharacterized membrane protein YkoI|nr:PepSY domain-containing protein [Gemmatimonadales bacterium]
MMRHLATLALCAGLLVPASRLSAQDAGVRRNVPDSLVAKAKVNEDSARAIALRRVPGTLQSVQLEKMRTRLVYEFEIQRLNQQGLMKVDVNAANGHVMTVARVGARSRRATPRSS